MKPKATLVARRSRKAISIGVTLVLTGAAAIIVFGIVELSLFNARALVAVESRTENVKAAAAIMEFASAQLAAHLGKIPETMNFATEARNFKFQDASSIFVGGQTAIGRGLIDTSYKVVAADGTSVPGTMCEVCAWPAAPLPNATDAPSPVSVATGPAEMKNVRSQVVGNALNSLDPMLGFAYSTSAYIPLRARIIGMPDSRGVRRNVYATALLWMRQGNLFRHTLYLNNVVYGMGSGGAIQFPGSIFSNSPMVYDLNNGSNPNNQAHTGTFQFERLSCPQLYICPTNQYMNYAVSAGYDSTASKFREPTIDPNQKIFLTSASWMGRGDLDASKGWTAFAVGTAFTGALTPLNADSRPLYITRQDMAGGYKATDISAFWQPYTTPSKNYATMLDSRNPTQLQTYAPTFNGSYTTNVSGFQPVLPDGIPAPDLARSIIEPPSLRNGADEPVAPAKPELPKPSSRAKNPALWDQWTAYESTSATDLANAESAKYGNKAGLYLFVDTEGNQLMFASAKDATAYKASSDRAEWVKNNPAKVLRFADSGVVSTSNVFYDTTRIDRGNNGTSLNGAPATALNNSNNGINTGNGDVTSVMDQSRVVRAVDIDMGALRKAVRTDGVVDGTGATRTMGGSSWTGVMYVDVENPMASTSATSTWGKTINRLASDLAYDVTASDGTPVLDSSGNPVVNRGVGFNGKTLTENINAKFHQTAVRFCNATQIPDVSQVGADMPAAKSDIPGFTLATNAMAYSVGSVNADGDMNTYPSNTSTALKENNAVDSSNNAFHTPFALVCDNHQYMSPGYQGNLDATGRLSNDRALASTNLDTVANLKEARGLALGDLATLLSINHGGVDGSGGTPKNPYTGAKLLPSASTLELTMAVVAGSNDLQQNGNMQCGPSCAFGFDNNASNTRFATNGSTVVLFKTAYRPRMAPNSANGATWFKSPVSRYDPNLGSGFVPPGSPSVRSFRLYGFKLISESEYNALALPVLSAVTAGGTAAK